ncbi:SRPBCC family protein [Histidinibacterium lentulum]|uniref:SRPBCC family protein n=1 Tax=Histidinibacterium lentulum TaxID=2480588 RepID=A0A3N2R137_9RHOB|nr:SRPBCC family protein [Histidinibacterium lentulum]ROU01185.1 SRPBCC family protein [Histidinibacterium lentulum]
MQFSVREDIEAPVDVVFARFSDFAHFERVALRRGAEVDRMDPSLRAEAGARWMVRFKFRGKSREVLIRIAEMDPPNGYTIATTSNGIEGVTTAEFVPLSPARTRLTFAAELKPRTLPARIVMQSLKLAKGRMDERLRTRITDYARDIEAGWHDGQL